MSSIQRASPFNRSLKSFLGTSWLSRSTAAGRIGRTSRSLSSEPVEPIDAIFTTVSDGYDSSDHLHGFQNVTRQLLANDVLTSLIQLQNDLHSFDNELQPYEPDIHSAQAANAYRHTETNLDTAASF